MTPASPAQPDTDTDAGTAALQAHYDAMWTRAWPAIGAGDVECDARLAAGPDPRRGLTLIARPGAALAARFDALLDRLEDAGARQYRHPRADMHMTVLSLFTVTDDPAPQLARLDDYRAAVAEALRGAAPFAVDFRGITVSRGAVLAQGFPRGAMLETLRERLRAALRRAGLDASLDGRYRLVTAHATLLRFIAPPRDPARLAAALAALRAAPLGTLQAHELELVINDWYMSSGSLQLVDRLPLA